MILSVGNGGFMGVLESIGQLLVLLLILAFVLFLAYYTSKWAAGFQNKYTKGSNMSVVETMRLQDGKLLQIVKVADKCIVIGLGKEEITYLCEIDPDSVQEVSDRFNAGKGDLSFAKVLGRFTREDNSLDGKNDDENNERQS